MPGYVRKPHVKWPRSLTKKFRQLIRVNPDILMRLSSQMARRLQVTSEKVGNLAFLDVTGRIAQTLLNLAKQPDAMTHPDGMQIKNHPPGKLARSSVALVKPSAVF